MIFNATTQSSKDAKVCQDVSISVGKSSLEILGRNGDEEAVELQMRLLRDNNSNVCSLAFLRA